jgi:uncharacterized membrane protein HdeD (DUF308 family)
VHGIFHNLPLLTMTAEASMTEMSQDVQNLKQKIEHNWGWILALGILLVLGGLVLIAAPLASSIAVTLLIAAVLVVGGVFQIIQAFRTQNWSGFLWSLIVGVIAVIGGIVIYTNPLAGTFALPWRRSRSTTRSSNSTATR